MRFGASLKHAWNVFTNRDGENSGKNFGVNGNGYGDFGSGYAYRPDRTRLRIPNERSIISSIYTRLGIDCASIDMRHVRLDDQDRYTDDVDSGLNNCLTVEANIDQAAQAFRLDVALTIFDKGVAALVPVDTSIDPGMSPGGYDIMTMRVGEITQWYPQHVQVWLYNEALGIRQQITLPKTSVAIVENPLFSVMNEPNSTLQRLLYKLNLLDAVDEQSASGNLDLIIQLPYVIKSEARRQQAEQRRKDIEFQLRGSQYGIAYTDGTERITQLNRPAENNLMTQIEYLTNLLYSQLGLTDAVMNGTADEKTMLNYWNRTIEPTLKAITEAMARSFLTKTARTQRQTVMYFRDPFRLIPIENIAKIADVFSRNEILSSNEIRQIIGIRPAKDPKADKLINSNIRGQTPSGFSQVSAAPAAPDTASSGKGDLAGAGASNGNGSSNGSGSYQNG